jgi:hypothetical protein
LSSEKIKKRSFISRLRNEGRINESFINTVSDLTLEELIGVKIEIAARMFKGKLYNLPLWFTFPRIVREALLDVAIHSCKTKADMSNLLGITTDKFNDLLKTYNKEIE